MQMSFLAIHNFMLDINVLMLIAFVGIIGLGDYLEDLDMETLVIYLFHKQSRPFKDFGSNK